MNTADVLVTLAVAGVLVLAIVILRRNKKAGKSGCGGDCARCCQGCKKQ